MKGKVPLIMIPGTLCTERTFKQQVAGLGGVAEPFVKLPTGGPNLGACAAQILEGAPERFALLGFSLGGLVALELMRQAPERVTRLCLLATNPRGSTAQNLAAWALWRREASSDGFAAIAEAHAEHVYKHVNSENAEARTVVTEMAFEVGPKTFIEQLGLLASRTDSRPSLGAISCPTLLVAGQNDRVTPPELHEEMQSLIPEARLETLPACGHYAALEQPQAVTKLLADWLEA